MLRHGLPNGIGWCHATVSHKLTHMCVLCHHNPKVLHMQGTACSVCDGIIRLRVLHSYHTLQLLRRKMQLLTAASDTQDHAALFRTTFCVTTADTVHTRHSCTCHVKPDQHNKAARQACCIALAIIRHMSSALLADYASCTMFCLLAFLRSSHRGQSDARGMHDT